MSDKALEIIQMLRVREDLARERYHGFLDDKKAHAHSTLTAMAVLDEAESAANAAQSIFKNSHSLEDR